MNENGIRKVAILVSALQRESADLVLDRLAGDQAELVRRAIFDLEPVDPSEQRRVIDEFLRAGPQPATAAPAVTFSRATVPEPAESGRDQVFESLKEMSPEGLSGVLAAERPQTIALVLSHLTPELSGQVLVQFPPQVQTEVLRRLVDLEETQPEILAEIEESLRARLAGSFALPRRRVAGLSAVEGILEAADHTVGGKLYQSLSSYDQQLAGQLRPEPLAFEDLERLDYADLQELLDAVEANLLSLALVGASPTVLHRILAALPASRAAALRHEMNHPAPTRLSDVEAARQRVGLIAQQIGIRLPRTAARLAGRKPVDSQFYREA